MIYFIALSGKAWSCNLNWLKGLSAALVVVVAVSLFSLWVARAGCNNQLEQQFVSENGLYKAVVFQRDCGATTGFSTQVSIIAADDEFCEHCMGDIMAADGHPGETQLRLRWAGDRELLVLLPEKVKIYRRETQWSHWFDTVYVRYVY